MALAAELNAVLYPRSSWLVLNIGAQQHGVGQSLENNTSCCCMPTDTAGWGV